MFDKGAALEAVLDRQIGFVRASESRAGFLVSALSLSFTLWIASFSVSDFSQGFIVLIGTVALVGILIAYYFLWLALFPNTSGGGGSLIFFGGIANYTLPDYEELVTNKDEEKYRSDLISQIHINSMIAKVKYKNVQLSLAVWYATQIPLLVFLVFSLEKFVYGS